MDNAGTLKSNTEIKLTEDTTLSGSGKIEVGYGTISGSQSGVVLSNINNKIDISANATLGNANLTIVNEGGGSIYSTKYEMTINTGNNAIINDGKIATYTYYYGGRFRGSADIRSAIENNGVIEQDGIKMTVHGAVTGTGYAEIFAGTLDFRSDFNEEVKFARETLVSPKLILEKSQSYAGSIVGFAEDGEDILELGDVGFVSSDEVTFSGTATSGVLTVTDGTHTARITFIGDYTDTTFVASKAGKGTAVIAIQTHHPGANGDMFVAAMASLSEPASHAPRIADLSPAQQLSLFSPGASHWTAPHR